MTIIWRCAACGWCEGAEAELRAHVWRKHAAQMLTDTPAMADLLGELAARQAANRAEVLAR